MSPVTAMRHTTLPASVNETTGLIVDCSMTVHRELGPGLLEHIYLQCLVHELRSRGATVQVQVKLPIIYRGVPLGVGCRVDLVVNDEVIVEVKAVAQMHPLHQAQLMTYLKLSGRRVGLLLNFNVPVMKDGITRILL